MHISHFSPSPPPPFPIIPLGLGSRRWGRRRHNYIHNYIGEAILYGSVLWEPLEKRDEGQGDEAGSVGSLQVRLKGCGAADEDGDGDGESKRVELHAPADLMQAHILMRAAGKWGSLRRLHPFLVGAAIFEAMYKEVGFKALQVTCKKFGLIFWRKM